MMRFNKMILTALVCAAMLRGSTATFCYKNSQCNTECTTGRYCIGFCVGFSFNKPQGTACGSSASSDCDAPDTCDGCGSCSPNHKPDTTLCGSETECLAAPLCSGTGSCAAPLPKDDGTPCGDQSSSACDSANTCQNGGCEPNNGPEGTICGDAPDDCHEPPLCDANGMCLDPVLKPAETACGAPANECSYGSQCDATGSCNFLGYKTDTITQATFEVWDGTTDAKIGDLPNNNGNYCLKDNWTVRVVTKHETSDCGSVLIKLWNKTTGKALRRQTETDPMFFLFGDVPGNIYGNTDTNKFVLVTGNVYCVRATMSYGEAEYCFTQSCS